MDLISRKAAIEAVRELLLEPDSTQYIYSSDAIDAVKSVPSVPAVPLDKLCVWLTKFGCPCEINEDMCDDAHGVDRCIGIFNSSAFCWQYWLTKMMEEQDAAD